MAEEDPETGVAGRTAAEPDEEWPDDEEDAAGLACEADPVTFGEDAEPDETGREGVAEVLPEAGRVTVAGRVAVEPDEEEGRTVVPALDVPPTMGFAVLVEGRVT